LSHPRLEHVMYTWYVSGGTTRDSPVVLRTLGIYGLAPTNNDARMTRGGTKSYTNCHTETDNATRTARARTERGTESTRARPDDHEAGGYRSALCPSDGHASAVSAESTLTPIPVRPRAHDRGRRHALARLRFFSK
jgi:hypothetical protein